MKRSLTRLVNQLLPPLHDIVEGYVGLRSLVRDYELVRTDIYQFHRIPLSSYSDELVHYVVENNSKYLRYIPKSMRTYELCLLAMRDSEGKAKYGNLHDVPYKHRDANICLAAVLLNGYALKRVPHKLQTPELRMIVAKNFERSMLSTVPSCLGENKSRCSRAVSESRFRLHLVPAAYRTKTLCFERIKVNPADWAHVPKKYRTQEFWLLLVQHNGMYLKNVPKKFKIKEVVHEAVRQNPLCIDFVPEAFKTFELGIVYERSRTQQS